MTTLPTTTVKATLALPGWRLVSEPPYTRSKTTTYVPVGQPMHDHGWERVLPLGRQTRERLIITLPPTVYRGKWERWSTLPFGFDNEVRRLFPPEFTSLKKVRSPRPDMTVAWMVTAAHRIAMARRRASGRLAWKYGQEFWDEALAWVYDAPYDEIEAHLTLLGLETLTTPQKSLT